MQPGEEIESLVSEIEQMVTEAKSPFMDGGNKKIIDAQDFYELLDEIRRVFPEELAFVTRQSSMSAMLATTLRSMQIPFLLTLRRTSRA